MTGCAFIILGNSNTIKKMLEQVREKCALPVKVIIGIAGMFITYYISARNTPFFEGTGWQHVVMALGLYGNYVWFFLGAIVGSISLLFIAMALEKINFLAWCGKFSLVFMAVHYILFNYVKPWCEGIQNMNSGNIIYPIAIAMGCWGLCIPICYVIDKVCPVFNGKYTH